MANNPQKSTDATDPALADVKGALNVRDAGETATNSADAAEGRQAALPTAPDLFHEEPRSSGWADNEPAERRAANDDRAAIGQILQALQRRPKRTDYLLASLVAAAWVIGGAAVAFLYKGELRALIDLSGVGIATVIALAAVIVIPVAFFYVIAHMITRAQEMRIVAQSMAEVAMRLADPEMAAREQIVTVGQAIRREVAAMGDGVERALARAAELEALVHNEVSALERAYNDNEVRIRGLLSDLSSQRDTLVGQAEQVRNAISSVHLDLAHDITSVGDLVAEKVHDVAQRITRSLTEKGEHITLALGHAGDSMIDALGERGGDLLERLETTSDKATHAIAAASDRLNAGLNFKTDHVQEEFAELANRLQQMMTMRLDQVTQGFAQKSTSVIELMSGRSRELTDAIVDTGGRLAETISSRVEEVNSTLRATGDSLVLDLSLRGGDVVAKMEQVGARVTDTIVARSGAVSETFRDSAEALVESINARGDAVKDMLAARLAAFEEMFTHGGTEITEKISRDSTTLGNLITKHIAEFDRTVKTYGGELVDRLGQRSRDVTEAMHTYIDSFDERVQSKTQQVSGTLDARLTQFETMLEGRVSELSNTLAEGGKNVVAALDQRISDVAGTINRRGTEVADALGAKIEHLDQTLGARAIEVANSLDTRIGRFEELLVGRAETVTAQIESRSKAAADALNARMEQLSQSIKTNAGEAERALGQLALSTTESIRSSAGDAERSLNALSANVSGVIKQNADNVERTLLGVSAEVARGFVGKADEITATVSQRATELTDILQQKSGGVIAAITEKGQEFAAEVGRATEQAVKAIENKGFAFTQTMLDNSEQLAGAINSAGANATTAVTQTLNSLQATTQAAIEQSKQTAAATVSEMLETHGMLRSDTTALFERLREANIMLQEVLNGAHENMSALENTMVLRVSEFVTAMNEVNGGTAAASERVEQNVANFREVTTRALTHLGQIADQFHDHGRTLMEAVQTIDRSNQQADVTLNERRSALDSLVATLDIRIDDLDQRLKRFSGLLDQSLEAAAVRARDIARVVTDASAEGTAAISEQFESVRATVEDERRRTTEAMRSIYEQSTGDTHAVFRDAAERFADVVQGMKQMSAEMQRELESTRAQLRRGILELPQETAESAAQMRRVIVDQIEALAELNRIVTRHGRGLDMVEPGRRDPREEPTLVMTGAREGSRGPRSEVGGFAPPAARRADSPSLSPAQGNGRGWLSDLLSRASREESQPAREGPRNESARGDERPPRHTIESLDSLSVDIARMIDHDAAADLWDRYKRGERNVFTRRLYTLQGQKTFDEIRKKYRADREFKQTVDRYIGEFERLLEEVSRDDRGQMVARTYLTSETGKVYTMLAHAAGRFD